MFCKTLIQAYLYFKVRTSFPKHIIQWIVQKPLLVFEIRITCNSTSVFHIFKNIPGDLGNVGPTDDLVRLYEHFIIAHDNDQSDQQYGD